MHWLSDDRLTKKAVPGRSGGIEGTFFAIRPYQAMFNDQPRLTDEEFVALRRLASADAGAISDDAMAQSLEQRGLIRPAPGGWAITVLGHRTFLSDLYLAF